MECAKAKAEAEAEELGVSAVLITRLRDRGINSLTAVQRLVVPLILRGESLVVRSQTGSGKSLAYLLPLAQRLEVEDTSQALVLVPTRELAQQVGRELRSISSVSIGVIHGGVEYEAQREVLRLAPRMIVSTVGRLRDLIEQGVVRLDALRYFILDEVDQMVDMGFREGILELSKLRKAGAQTLCFSATIGEKEESVLREIVGEYEVLTVESEGVAVERIAQRGYYVRQELMPQLLIHLLRGLERPLRAIVFCRSRKMADSLCVLLRGSEMSCETIHSDRSQAAREHILERFRAAQTELLVATDLVARGVDVVGVSHVFNFGLPQSVEQYIHRIGRTARAGAEGEAISLVCPDEAKLLGEICATMRRAIPMSTSHPYMTPDVTRALSAGTESGKRRKKR